MATGTIDVQSSEEETDEHSQLPPVQQDLVAGIDVGGTKVHIVDSLSGNMKRYVTTDYPSMDAVLEDYFTSIGARPARIVIGMAGPRDDETGSIALTNLNWPTFDPDASGARYGITFSTANDMEITMAGVLQETGIDLVQLKSGTPTRTGAKIVVTLSTGIGTASAVWDNRSKRYVIAAGEGGHIGFQPKTEGEERYLAYLHQKYTHASAELAVAGKHGVDNLVDHMVDPTKAPLLAHGISRARDDDRPIGMVLLGYATEGSGSDQQVAQGTLQHMGSILGAVLRDLAVTHKATGGIYLTGSVALGLGEYFCAVH